MKVTRHPVSAWSSAANWKRMHIYKEYIGVDACACNLMRPAMYGAYHHKSLDSVLEARKA